MAIFVSIGENITHRVREKYLQAVMRQNIGWFDEEGAGEVTTRISSDTLLVQDAISDKVPLCFSQIATVLAGFIIAFIKCWQLTLVLMVVFPVIAMAAVSTNILASRFQVKILSLYGNAGSYAEESISSVRTVVAFNGQHKMTTRYTKELLGARIMGLKKASTTGFGVGFLFFIIYLGYSLAFYYGPELLNWGLATGGVIVNVFFAVLIGAFAIGNIAPDFQAFALGRSAAAKIYQTIDRVPSIDTESVSGIKLKPEDTTGHIIFKNAKVRMRGYCPPSYSDALFIFAS